MSAPEKKPELPIGGRYLLTFYDAAAYFGNSYLFSAKELSYSNYRNQLEMLVKTRRYLPWKN